MNPSGTAARYSRLLFSLLPGFLLIVATIALVTQINDHLAGAIGLTLALIAGICFGLGSLLFYWNGVDVLNMRLVRRHLSPETLKDGATVVFDGKITCEAEPLQAPFSDVRCVALRYEVCVSRSVHSQSANRQSRVLLAAGIHLLPCAISNAGQSLRLLSFPVLESETRISETGERWNDRIVALFARQSGVESGGDGQREALWLEAQNTPIGEVHHEFFNARGEHGKGNYTVEEEVLPVDIHVTAIGTYDASAEALLARNSRIGPNLMVYRGNPQEVLERVSAQIEGYNRFTKAFLLVAGALLVLSLLPPEMARHVPLFGGLVID